MQNNIRLIAFYSIICFIFIGFEFTAAAHAMDLVGMLTKNLGVSQQQAEGGAGSIFNVASQNMSAADFTKVTEAMPEVTSLMNAAPKAEAGSGTVGGLSSMLTKGGTSMGALSELAGSFSTLGLGGDMVGKFIPIVLEYAQSKGGDTVANLLKMALQ